MAEARQALVAMDDATLEGALRDLASAIAYPSTAAPPADVATMVRQRIAAGPTPRRASDGPFRWLRARPIRRSLLVAVAVLLLLAAVAGAVGLGVPGIRILFGGPTLPPSTPAASVTPPASLGTLGQNLGLGTTVSLGEAERLGQLDLVLPPDPAIGPPDASFLYANRVALVWGERPGLPPDASSGVALLISEFNGAVDDGFYTKVLDGGTTVTPVTVGGSPGYWIAGQPHVFFYTDATGKFVDDTHRSVGNTLIWNDGEVTYRLEAQVGMEDAIRIADSLR